MMKKYLQLLLALVMFKPTPIADTHEFTYVDFGDSQAAGLGLHGFVPEEFYDDPTQYFTGEQSQWNGAIKDGYYGSGYVFQSEKSYPKLIRNELRKTHWNVNFIPCAMNAMRAMDLDILLNDKDPDVYEKMMVETYLKDIEPARRDIITIGNEYYVHSKEQTSVRDEMINAVKKADLITYDLGVNDFGGYLMIGQFNELLKYYYNVNAADLTNLLSVEMVEIYEKAKGYILDKVTTAMGEEIPQAALAMVNQYADIFSYALIGYMESFDSTMARIYELNPDVEVIVMSIQNIYEGIDMKLDDGTLIPFGDIVGGLMSIANAYTAYFSPFASKYYYADFGNGHVEDYLTQFRDWYTNDGSLESLLEMTDFIDALNVYSTEQVEFNIKNEIAAERNIRNIKDELLSYDEIMNLDRRTLFTMGLDRAFIEEMEKELSVKTKLAYYTYAKAFAHAAMNGVMSSSTTVSAYETLTDVGEIATAFESKYNSFASEETNLNTLLPMIDAKIDSTFGGEGNAEKASALFTALVQAQFANAFMIHRNANGHKECAKEVLKAHYLKNNKRHTDAKTLVAMLPAIIAGFDWDKAFDIVKDVMIRVNAFIVGDEPIIKDTVADIWSFIHGVEDFLEEYKPIIDEVTTIVNELIELFGIDLAYAEFVAENPEFLTFLDNVKEAARKSLEATTLTWTIIEFIEIIRNTFIGDAMRMPVEKALEFVAPYVAAVEEKMKLLVKVIGETVVGVAGITAFVTANVNMFIFESMKYAAKSATEIAGVIVEKVAECMTQAAGNVAEGLKIFANNVAHGMSELASAAFSISVDVAKGVIVVAIGTFKTTIEVGKETIPNALDVGKQLAELTAGAAIEFVTNLKQYANDTLELIGNVAEHLASVEYVVLAEELKSAVVTVAGEIVDKITSTIDSVYSKIVEIKTLADDYVGDLLDLATSLYGALKSDIDGAKSAILNVATTIYTVLAGKVGEAIDTIEKITGMINDGIAWAIDEAKEFIGEVYDKAEAVVSEALDVVEDIYDKVEDKVEDILDVVEEIYDKVEDKVEEVLDVVGEVYDKVEDKVEEVLDVVGEVYDKAEAAVLKAKAVVEEIMGKVATNVEVAVGVLMEVKARIDIVIDKLAEVYDEIPEPLIEVARETMDKIYNKFVSDTTHLKNQIEGFLSVLGSDVANEEDVLTIILANMIAELNTSVENAVNDIYGEIIAVVRTVSEKAASEAELLIAEVMTTVNENVELLTESVETFVENLNKELHTPIIIDFNQDIEGIEEGVAEVVEAAEEAKEAMEEQAEEAGGRIWDSILDLLEKWNLTDPRP